MAGELLLEIGTEEIPSGYLEDGLKALKILAEAAFRENRIHLEGDLYTCGTPRRLVLIGKDIAERQEDLVQEVTGPPKSVAYDNKGESTKAALGFAEKQGVSVASLECITTPRGEYVSIKKRIPGRPTQEILQECLPKIIGDITWPKSMRWGDVGFSFVRPIHWVLALFNGKIVTFEVGGVRSGKTTWGHRFMRPQSMEVSSVEDYYRKMEKSFVLLDHRKREKEVERLVRNAAGTVRGDPAEDAELIKTVTNLVEYPSAVCGGFDSSFLEIPDSVLITAMKEHQRYFSVYDREGTLMPNFVAVNNTLVEDESVVQRGHERVLRARLSDASFFFEEDRKRPLGDRLEDLKEVIYQAELGTSYAKVQRFTKLAEYLAEKVLPDRGNDVKTVAGLCKCDLVTQMVNEFPSLQGVMGEEYARIEGYASEICSAIREHYLPMRSGGKLPTSEVGAVVGCADRLDTIAGCFAIGLEPTGSTDPFALRRHSLAIIRIIDDRGWNISLREFIEKALFILSEELGFEKERVFERVIEFFRERYKYMMLGSDYESDTIEAVISVEFDRIKQMGVRIAHLKRFASESDEFQALALTSKRVSNILKKQEVSFDVDPDIFKVPVEFTLWDTYRALKPDIDKYLEDMDYYRALSLMAKLRKPVDDFFDGAEILVKGDPALRENRVGILQHLSELFLKVADLSKFSI